MPGAVATGAAASGDATVHAAQGPPSVGSGRPQFGHVERCGLRCPEFTGPSASLPGGSGLTPGVASSNDPVVWTEWRYKANAADGWIGYDAAGKGDGSGDPAIEALINKARQEVDIDKRKGYVGDIQKALGKSMYLISEPGVSDGFDLAWPALMNHRAFQGDRRTQANSWWLDDTKAPLKKA